MDKFPFLIVYSSPFLYRSSLYLFQSFMQINTAYCYFVTDLRLRIMSRHLDEKKEDESNCCFILYLQICVSNLQHQRLFRQQYPITPKSETNTNTISDVYQLSRITERYTYIS